MTGTVAPCEDGDNAHGRAATPQDAARGKTMTAWKNPEEEKLAAEWSDARAATAAARSRWGETEATLGDRKYASEAYDHPDYVAFSAAFDAEKAARRAVCAALCADGRAMWLSGGGHRGCAGYHTVANGTADAILPHEDGAVLFCLEAGDAHSFAQWVSVRQSAIDADKLLQTYLKVRGVDVPIQVMQHDAWISRT